MDEIAHRDMLGSAVRRDKAVSVLSGVGLFLVFFLLFAAAVLARTGYVGPLLAACILMLAFSVAGMALGLARAWRSARTRRNA